MLTLLYFSIQDNFDLRIKRTRYLIILADTYVFLPLSNPQHTSLINKKWGPLDHVHTYSCIPIYTLFYQDK